MLKVSTTKKCVAILTAGVLLTTKNFLTPRVTEKENAMKGVAISEKTKSVNWDEISKNYDFVLLNAGTGLKEDEKFEEYYKKAKENNLNVGVFIDNQLSTYYDCDPNCITKYAEMRYSHVKIGQMMDKDISYPVYLKIDFDDIPIEIALPKEHANSLFDRFELIMTHNHYIPGVYSTEEIYNYLKENIDNFDERFVHIIDTPKKLDVGIPDEVTEQESNQVVEEKVIDKETPIKGAPLSEEVQILSTNTDYNDRSLAFIPGLLLSMDALGCIGAQLIYRNKKKKEEKEQKVLYR